MNSLQELNTFGNSTITYTDTRPAAVKFDRINATNQAISVNQHDTHPASPGFQIIDVIRPTDCLPTYTINVSGITGATVTWPVVPSGCTVTNPSTGVYRISGVNSATTWNIVRNPTINLTVSYVGVGTYTCTVTWNSTQTKTSTTTLTVVDIDIFGSNPSDFYFLGGVAGTITGNPVIIDNYSTTWTATVTPSTTSLITSLTSAGSGGTSSFNGTTKVLTIAGTKTQVNSHLNSISYVIPSSTKQDFTFQYGVVNDTLLEGDSRTQQMFTTEILSATRSTETYATNTSTTISNGPLITDALYTGTGNYAMTITPSTTAAVSSFTIGATLNYWPSYTTSGSFDSGSSNDGGGGIPSLAHNTTMTYIAYADSAANSNLGKVLVYTRSGNVISLQQELTPTDYDPQSGSNKLYFGSQIVANSNFNVLAILARGDNLPTETDAEERGAVYIFRRSGTTWTQELRAINTEVDASYYYQHVSISPDGNTFCATNGVNQNGTVRLNFYNYRSGFWYLDSTVTTTGVRQIIGFTDNNYFFVGGPNETASGLSTAGAVFVFKRTADTWAQQTIIYPENPVAGNYFGSISYSRILSDGRISIGSLNGANGIYSLVDGSWTKTSSLAYTYPSVLVPMTSDLVYYTSSDRVYQLQTNTYNSYCFIGDNSLVVSALTPASRYVSSISADGTYIIQWDSYVAGSPSMFVKTSGDPNKISFNNTTKVLTITEVKAQVNTFIDTIVLVPETDYAEDFTLTYSVVTPTSTTDSRTQLVTHTS
jgi:hypothetical protein